VSLVGLGVEKDAEETEIDPINHNADDGEDDNVGVTLKSAYKCLQPMT